MNIFKMLINNIYHEYIQDAIKTPYAMNIFKMLIKHDTP